MSRLHDRGIIVTGASGIAAASARLFAAEGARVMIVSRTEARCVELVEAIIVGGGDARYAVADLRSAQEAEAAADAAIGWLGRVDGLFNVAGGSGRALGDGPLHEMSAEGWAGTLRLNLDSHVFLTAAILRAMLTQERDAAGSRGAIVNTGSVLAEHPVPGLFATHAYAAAKGAIRALTISSAAYYAPDGIRVNAVAPALTHSRMSRRAAEDATTREFSRRKQPLADGFIDPDAVAAAALYLISADAGTVTGQILSVDGGWSVSGLDG